MDYKKTNAARTTETRDNKIFEDKVGNIYAAISVMEKRANQINSEIKEELIAKLDEFATNNENLDEIFENKEQIEVSKYYERLPKPSLIAIQELLEDKIHFREADTESNN